MRVKGNFHVVTHTKVGITPAYAGKSQMCIRDRQNFNTFVDETSGLFNRKYMNFYLEKAHKTNPRQLYGLMMDVNDFKKINDRYGHSMGDREMCIRDR